eukprot:CAMPEP_0181335660 /NCGR_PEP_ID=MMETSP1101-20121128/26962_1 /TAXON_ID=46948 /ORGANISM="Rhodomonas abbreviata, Strain Caron Lab Isolate" /LENGTH=1086 /DNA_ID=CAMNT_0023445819 /DNA_START=67 /DNA_END=3327 /DNA_ORIENTATION=-
MAAVKEALKAMIVDHRAITPEEATAAMKDLMSGAATPAQTGSFLSSLQQQPLDPALLRSCAEGMVSFAQPCPVPDNETLVDIVGTGGDGLDTFNVSTAAGIVLAACGVRCAKHGNRSASGAVGSADFLEALGCRVTLNGEQVAEAVGKCGFGFLFAQIFHPSMKNVAVARKELGVRTIFNLLGPLTNPSNPALQVIGVGKKEVGPVFAELFKLKGAKQAMIVHSSEGLDEISPAAATHVWHLKDGVITEKQITPADFGLPAHDLLDVQGGTAQERATLFREILGMGKKRKMEGQHAAVCDYIIANAAATLLVAGKAGDLKAAADMAREAITSGAASKVLEEYVALTLALQPNAPPPPGGAAAFTTAGGVGVTRTEMSVDGVAEVEKLVDKLDERKGMLMMSTFEYPGRYTLWKVGFVDPPLMFSSRNLTASIVALNARGLVLLQPIRDWLKARAVIESVSDTDDHTLTVVVAPSDKKFTEEERSLQPSMFTLVRELIACFASPADQDLGLYGAFAYDLTFQFEPCRMRLERDARQRDLVLYLPDSLLLVGHDSAQARQVSYEFSYKGTSTTGLARTGTVTPFKGNTPKANRDHEPGEYAKLVEKAKEEFKCGNLFEAVCSQTFYEPCNAPPSEIHRRIRVRNPSPYSFFIHLGDAEFLVGASPEMYVRSSGRRVETCPISGTIARGKTPIEDAHNIKELLNSIKEESELTMCTDVDRNDKSRICEPGSVKVLGRRQIEMYSRLIHTVDHVEGTLRQGFDALDAFLAHTWAVTVTGAPKAWAMQFLEDNERTPRCWYGGAVGQLGFDGNINTGLTLRTIRIVDGVAQVRAGATLLFDSDPPAEEAETQLKASALLDAIRRPSPSANSTAPDSTNAPPLHAEGKGKRVLLIDHQDSFVHTLANYIRQTGAEVVTIRSNPNRVGLAEGEIDRLAQEGGAFAMAVLSPGPGNPTDFQVPKTIEALEKRRIPIFGVCLGLQGMIERYGGKLDILPVPVHGKPSVVQVKGDQDKGIFSDLPTEIMCGRYHSLYCADLPKDLEATAHTADGCIMGIRHKTLPVAAVQFHPESILTAPGCGVRMLANALTHLRY